MANNPFDDPVFKAPPMTKEGVEAQRASDNDVGDSRWGHLVDLVSGAVTHILPDTAAFFGDVGNAALKGLSNNLGTISPDYSGRQTAPTRNDIPGRGPASQLAERVHNKVYGPDVQPDGRGEQVLYQGIRGAADMVPFALGAPGPALLSGVMGGVGSEGAHELFPNSDWAPLVGGLVGGVAGGMAPGIAGRVRTGFAVRAGMAHPDYEALVNEAILPNEGGGTLDHPKVNAKSGATGPMQVTPETARDPGYGIRPWDGESQADLARVGRQKFAVLLGKYDDPEKALAAYNWGEGNLNKAVSKYGDLWYDHAPQETQDYVAKGMTRVYGGPKLEGPPGPDGLPTNGSVPPIDPKVYDLLMERQARDTPPVEPTDVLTPAERQDMDASVERPPSINAATDRLENSSTNEPPPLPANDIEGKSATDLELEKHLNTPENIAGAKEVWDSAHEDYLSKFKQPDDYNSALIKQQGGTGNKFTMPPEEFQNALDHADEAVKKYWQDKADDHLQTLRDQNSLARSETFGTNREPPREGPKAAGGHDEPIGPEGELPTPTEKLQKILNDVGEMRSNQDATLSEIRRARMSEAGRRANVFTGEAGAAAKMGALKGKLPETKIRSYRPNFSQEDLDGLFNTIQQHPAIDWQTQLHATTGLQKLLVPKGNLLPTRSELNALNLVFPKEMVEGLKKHSSLGEILINTLNIPRALMASTDFSAPLRQGLFMIGRKEFRTAFPDMFKNAFSQKDFDAMKSEIASRPTFHLMEEGGLSLTDVGQDLSKREEAFMSNYAEQIPGGIGSIVKASDRAYVSFLNKIRADVFDSLVKSYEELNGESIGKNPKALKDLGEYINAATGRGSLGRFTQSAPFLSTVFFSPRLIASRLQLLNPLFYARLDPFVRKEALKDLFRFAGVALTTLGLAKMAGADVVADPRSTDFGKIRIKDTRFDILGGFQQYLRVFGQIITGQTKNANTGKVTNLPGPGLHLSPGEKQGDYKPTTRKDVAENLILNKFSPVLSFVTDMLRGSNAVGQKPDWSVKGPANEGYVNWNNPIIQRVTPLIIQDTQDAFKEYGAESKIPYAVAGTGVFGVGTQTYQPIKHEKKSKVSDDPFKDPIFAGTSKTNDPFKDEVFK